MRNQPRLLSIFRRAMAVALAASPPIAVVTAVVTCGGKTTAEQGAPAATGSGEIDPPGSTDPVEEGCKRTPNATFPARSERCENEVGDGSSSFACQTKWYVPRPRDVAGGSSPDKPTCVSLCEPRPSLGPDCDPLCTSTRAPPGCKAECDWIVCSINIAGVSSAGRRPPGFVAFVATAAAHMTPSTIALDPVAAYFVEMAELEAASVDAFRILHDELVAYGAPPSLIAWASRSARDEIRHAHDTAELARRFDSAAPRAATMRSVVGGASRRPTAAAVRPLEEIARDNAVEGCVRETFGALSACWQADHAADEAVRDAMRAIAKDETSHAQFSWALHAWLSTRLSADEQARVRSAKANAVAELFLTTMTLTHDARLAHGVASTVGAPSSLETQQMLASLRADLWS